MADIAIAEKSALTKLPRTPPQILGPFYPFMHTPIETGDLTGGGAAQGTILYLTGRVLADDGTPVSGAKVEIWQANAGGRYSHPNDENAVELDEKVHRFCRNQDRRAGALCVQDDSASGLSRGTRTLASGAYPFFGYSEIRATGHPDVFPRRSIQ